MFRAIFLQAMTTIVVAMVASLLVGVRGAVSAALGGAVSALPNFLFALRLKFTASQPGNSYTENFFLGEIIKLVLMVGLLMFVIWEYADLHWPSLLIGMVLALQAGFLAFWKKS